MAKIEDSKPEIDQIYPKKEWDENSLRFRVSKNKNQLSINNNLLSEKDWNDSSGKSNDGYNGFCWILSS